MKILHSADWHLGARLGTQDRIEDQFARLEELCTAIDEHEVDLLLVAGDIFDEHRSEPLGRIIGRLARVLKPRLEDGLNIVFVAGNHDREHVFPLLAGLQELVAPGEERRVVFASRPDLATMRLRSGEELQLMLLPYPTATRYDLADQRWPSPDAKRAALGSEVRRRIQEFSQQGRVDKTLQTVVCGHLLIRGASGNAWELSEQEDVPIEAGDLPPFSYIALGHIHRAQEVGAGYIRYCGSIERMDRGESADDKVAYLVEITKSGLEDITEVKFDATPIASVVASSEAELKEAAVNLDVDRTLVSVTLDLEQGQSVAALQGLARALFPRLYRHPEVRLTDAPRQDLDVSTFDSTDVRGTVRKFLSDALEEDTEKDVLLQMADELLDEALTQ